MVSPTLTSLPVEIHGIIRYFLLRNDEIILGLTCIHLYDIYARDSRKSLLSFTSKSFFARVADDAIYGGWGNPEAIVAWQIRNDILPRLRSWIARVRYALKEPEETDKDLEICVGCAWYKVPTDDWTEGVVVVDRMDSVYNNRMFDTWLGEGWRHIIMRGKLCKPCCQELKQLRTWWSRQNFELEESLEGSDEESDGESDGESDEESNKESDEESNKESDEASDEESDEESDSS